MKIMNPSFSGVLLVYSPCVLRVLVFIESILHVGRVLSASR